MSTISTHVLDTSLGRPAEGVRVTLERLPGEGAEPQALRVGVTNDDGRVRDLLPPGETLGEGTYRLRFEVTEYFARTNRETFYSEITVLFRVGAREEHYHVPLLLSPYGYSTYRGS